MSRVVRLDKLRALARLYADQRTGGSGAFVPDTDGGLNTVGALNDLINLALTELYDLLVEARGPDYYAASTILVVLTNVSSYTLPSSFYRMQGVVLEWGAGNHETVEELARVTDRASFTNDGVWSQFCPKAYRLRGTSIEFFPTPSVGVNCRLYYIPAFQDLLVDSDTFDGVNGWEKLVALRVAMELRTIEEQPYGDLERLYDRERARIEQAKTEREAAQPKVVQQVYPEMRAAWPVSRRPLP